MDKAKKSILVPIFFFSFFQFPLTVKELRRYLWRDELSEDEIRGIIKEIPRIRFENDFVWHGELANDRELKKKISGKLWSKVKRWRWVFSNVPFLTQVFVSNTLAYDNVYRRSDIDLFLIGKQGRLWTTRAFLLFWFNLFGLRVKSVNRYAKFSPELFISDQSLDVRSLTLNNDYYFSFWLADLTPIWPDGRSGAFRQTNSWFKDDLPIAWRSPKDKTFTLLKPSLFRMLAEKILSNRLGGKLEKMLYRVQSRIIKKNIERLGVNPEVVINENVIKLHFNDRRARVRDDIEKKLINFSHQELSHLDSTKVKEVVVSNITQ